MTDFVKDPERALPYTALGILSTSCHLCPSSKYMAQKSLPLAQYQHGTRNSLRRRPRCQQGVCRTAASVPVRARRPYLYTLRPVRGHRERRSLQLFLKLGCEAPSPAGSGASPPQKASSASVSGFPRTSKELPERLSPRALRKPAGRRV